MLVTALPPTNQPILTPPIDPLLQVLTAMREQNATLQQQNAALRRQVSTLTDTTQALFTTLTEQTQRIYDLAQRVDTLTRDLAAVRGARNMALEQGAQAHTDNLALRLNINTHVRDLQIAHLREEKALLMQRLAQCDQFRTQTASLFAGGGALSGALWGAVLGGPMGATLGGLLGAAATVVAGQEQISLQSERTPIEERLKQVAQQLLALGIP